MEPTERNPPYPAVFVAEIDEEHEAIGRVVGEMVDGLCSGARKADLRTITHRLVDCVEKHFAHEERLMRAEKYEFFGWHNMQHNAARKRLREFVRPVEKGDDVAAGVMITFLSTWLEAHAGLADSMMGAFLRNRRRGRTG